MVMTCLFTSVYQQGGYFPILCTFVILLLSSAAVSRGVSTFEPVNLIIVPILLLTLAFSFYWAIFLPYASVGITHLFTPDWGKFIHIEFCILMWCWSQCALIYSVCVVAC